MTEKELIAHCRKQNRKAQELLYERYAPTMFGVCRRYLKNQEDAEDVLLEAMYKVFANIDSFKELGSFEGWIRRIVINEALMFLRRRHNFNTTVELSGAEATVNSDAGINAEEQLAEKDILALLNRLPTGYRTVFNLYVLEGYKHKEIAEMLGISINTSKSQLILAKDRLRSFLVKSSS